MYTKQLQCKDVPTIPILEHLEVHGGIGCSWYFTNCPRTVTNAMPPGLPAKIILGKMRQLIRNGNVAGCPCGCRGDYELTEKGKRTLRAHRLASQGG